ncbi:MAG: transcription initiation factor IIB [Candidatus Aenigmatarchaeota archaeon]
MAKKQKKSDGKVGKKYKKEKERKVELEKESKNTCKYCGSTNVYEDINRGEIICAKCGAVLDEYMIDTTQEWRAFDSEQMSRRSRTGAPLTAKRHDKGLTTEIGRGTTELFKVPIKKRGQYFRLRKWQKRLITSKDRNLSFALGELERLVSFLGLPKTLHEEVSELYEKALEKGLIRGRSIESIIAALVYALSREYKSPRTLAEISQATGISKRELGRTYRYISRKLKLRIVPSSAEAYIPRFASLLQLKESTEVKAMEILKKALKKEVISGKGPCGCAAAAIYIASVLNGERRTQREIADIVGVTEVTIRNRYKEIAQALGIEEEVERKAKELEEQAEKEK